VTVGLIDAYDNLVTAQLKEQFNSLLAILTRRPSEMPQSTRRLAYTIPPSTVTFHSAQQESQVTAVDGIEPNGQSSTFTVVAASPLDCNSSCRAKLLSRSGELS